MQASPPAPEATPLPLVVAPIVRPIVAAPAPEVISLPSATTPTTRGLKAATMQPEAAPMTPRPTATFLAPVPELPSTGGVRNGATGLSPVLQPPVVSSRAFCKLWAAGSSLPPSQLVASNPTAGHCRLFHPSLPRPGHREDALRPLGHGISRVASADAAAV